MGLRCVYGFCRAGSELSQDGESRSLVTKKTTSLARDDNVKTKERWRTESPPLQQRNRSNSKAKPSDNKIKSEEGCFAALSMTAGNNQENADPSTSLQRP
jgi:hypothetical protein